VPDKTAAKIKSRRGRQSSSKAGVATAAAQKSQRVTH
jgi:hypothetical protein